MDRRHFIQGTTASVTSLAAPAFAGPNEKHQAPFRTIYSNDTTNILSCKMPWRDRSDPLSDAHLSKSITEASGADAHFLQPGLGWIPWWKSEIYSSEEHYSDFLQNEHGHKNIDKIGRYLLEGGDMLKTLVETCRKIGVAPFLSFRLNDGHHVRQLKESLETGIPSAGMSRHYWENYESFRIGNDLVDWDQGVFDWSIPEVRDHKFALIEEACANYDLAGLELDFLRHWIRFGTETSIEERRKTTTDFVKRTREMLDRTAEARGLPKRWLCLRVPAKKSVRPDQGIDLKALAEAGADMINLSYSYFTVQDDSVREAVQEIASPQVAVYVEMTHCTMTGKATNGSGTQPFLRTTDEQFLTTAELAHEQGAQGVSLFNFPYYRYHATDTIGPFHEPPFEIIPRLSDRDFLENDYARWNFLTACRRDRVLGERVLPVIINREPSHTFTLEMLEIPPERESNGILRLRSDESIADREIEVQFNDKLLVRTEFVEKPIQHPYEDTWLGTKDEFACYKLPGRFVESGKNRVEVKLNKGIRVRLISIDAAFN